VELIDYTYYLMRFYNKRFSWYIYWYYFIFNIIIYYKAKGIVGFYISKALNLKNLNREELANTLY